jgi:hypothetical protein
MIKKSYIGVAVLLAGFALSFQSCKKGDNDPISLKSRIDRLKGDWSLSEKSVNRTDASNSGSISVSTINTDGNYNGDTETVLTNTGTSSFTSDVYKYDFDITFDENGTYQYTLNLYRPTTQLGPPYNNSVYITTGVWAWLDQGSDKLGLSLNSDFTPLIPDTLNPGTLLPYVVDGAYNIDRLASDQLVLKRSGQFTTTIDTVITNTTYNGTFTFER